MTVEVQRSTREIFDADKNLEGLCKRHLSPAAVRETIARPTLNVNVTGHQICFKFIDFCAPRILLAPWSIT